MNSGIEPKKSLGQHWLKDKAVLNAIVDGANISKGDVILEIGPGLGDLTKELVERAGKVVAIELDNKLALNLEQNLLQHNSGFTRSLLEKKLEVIHGDILKLDLNNLPPGYKVVANIPYYLTSNLIRVLSESSNPPAAMALLVQKEVAQRICAAPGAMSTLSVSAQLYYECRLGQVVEARMFSPPPKVDSQVVHFKLHSKPLFDDLDAQNFFKIVKAGFSERRKKLRSSLSSGLKISKEEADKLLQKAGIGGNKRAQELSLKDWHSLLIAMLKK